MWNDYFWLSAIMAAFMTLGLYCWVRWNQKVGRFPVQQCDPEVAVKEALALELKTDHYYLFVYDIRSASNSVCNKIERLLRQNGIQTGHVRLRGPMPIIYDLKQPEKGIKSL